MCSAGIATACGRPCNHTWGGVRAFRTAQEVFQSTTPNCDPVSVKPTGPELFFFDLVSRQPWLCMAPKKRTSAGAVKTAFVAIKNVKDGQTVSAKGKVLSKSAIVSFGYMFWNSWVFRAVGSSEASIA